jgi:hypothetical protein
MSDNDKTVPLEPVADAVADAHAEAADAASAAPADDAVSPEPPAAPAEPMTAAQAAPASSAPWTITITTDASAARQGRPRTRWAAIVWGLIIAGIAATTLAIVGSPERRQAVSDWAATLTPGAFWILSVLVVGMFILVLAVLALIRRAQRRRSAV